VNDRLRATTLVLALGLCGVAPPLASADMQGTVLGSAAKGGSAYTLPGASVTAIGAAGNVLASTATDASGVYVLKGIGGVPDAPVPAPALTLTVTYTDPCADPAHQKLSASLRVAAGARGYLPSVRLDARRMCAAPSSDFTAPAPPPTAYVDAADARIIGPPGGIAYVRLPLGFPSQYPKGVAMALLTKGFRDSGFKDDLMQIGANYDPVGNPLSEFRVKLPLAAGSAPLLLSYGLGGTSGTVIGSITVLNSADPLSYRTSGTDIELAVDVSEQMKAADPRGLRKDAVRSLLALAGASDRVGGLVFNDRAEQVFELQGVTAANAPALAAQFDRRITDSGGTDDDDALEGAFNALSSPKTYDPERAKTVILLTNGERRAGDDRSAHLLMRVNPSGHSWPVCVVALGARIAAADQARLQRIASQTRGQYVPARTASDLGAAFGQCLATATGRQIVADRSVTFTKRIALRRVAKKLAANTSVARWFTAAAARAGLQPVLIDPGGGRHTPTVPGKNVAFRKGDAFSLFTVLHPRAGTWTLVLTPKAHLAARTIARVTVTAE
jgi:hypothetical protein